MSVAGLVVLCGAVLLACTGGDDAATVTTLDEDAARARIQELAARARDDGFDRQAELLADGVVTEAEYRQATLWSIECMEEAGLEVTDFREVGTLTSHRFDWLAGPGTSGADDAGRITDRCQREFDLSVIQAWGVQDRGVIREELRAPFGECLREAGIEVQGEPVSLDQLYREAGGARARSSIGGCRIEIEASLLDPSE